MAVGPEEEGHNTFCSAGDTPYPSVETATHLPTYPRRVRPSDGRQWRSSGPDSEAGKEEEEEEETKGFQVRRNSFSDTLGPLTPPTGRW